MSDVKITAQTRAVLLSVLQAGAPICGVEVRDATRLKAGTVYPMLIRLRGAGLLVSRQEAGTAKDYGRPRRCYYELTEAGEALAMRLAGSHPTVRAA